MAPKPSEIDSLARDIAKTAQRLQGEARWLHGIAYDRHVGDSVKVRSHAADPTQDLATPDHEKHTRVEPSCRGCQRQVLAGAHTRMLAILKSMNQLEASLHHAIGENRGKMADAQRMVRDGPWPRIVTKAELVTYEEASGRRAERGESIP